MSAGEYDAPPAQGPMMAEICGMTPEASVFIAEDVRVAAEALDAFLDARAARVVQADHRRAGLHRQVHDLADLLGEGVGQAAAEHREVLGEREDRAAVDRAVAGDDAVAGDALLVHPEVVAAVGPQLVDLDEGAAVEQQLDALARHQQAALVALGDLVGAAADLGFTVAAVQLFQNVGTCHFVGVRWSGRRLGGAGRPPWGSVGAYGYREGTEKTRVSPRPARRLKRLSVSPEAPGCRRA